ncbi:MAG: 3'-5' exonuclease [Phycisphaeraceae bacterium]
MSETMRDGCFNETESDERDYLRDVLDKIASELSAYSTKVDSRHAETRSLVLDLQENKADMDHAEKASMRQSVNLMTRVSEHGVEQQRRLSKLVDTPYFGRIDINFPDRGKAEPLYVGIHSFYDDASEQQLIHDWRAPISSVFYESELGAASYEAPSGRVDCELVRKRQYRIENRELMFMLETSLTIQDDVLQKELSQASDDKMKNIVATIQRDQNAIIRNDASHTLIIQGAAGSGKTSIALHRIAFLLYKYKETIRSNEILILSPNNVFAHYISQVLPELGEEMVQETTMELLAAKLLTHQVKFQTFYDQVSQLLKDAESAYAQRVRFKATGDFLKQLDAYVWHLRTTNFQPAELEIGQYTFDAAWVGERFRKFDRLPISEQLNQMTASIVEHMKTVYQKQVVNKDRSKLRAGLKQMFSETTLKAIYKNFYSWLGKPEMFKQMKGGRYEYADVFPLIYLKMVVDGDFGANRIKHVVIDEMQDYTPIQYQVISKLYPCKKTILGDQNQSVSPLSSSTAEGIGEILHQAECMYMHKSYRSTLQITQLAQRIHRNPNLVPIERHGEKPSMIGCDEFEQEVAVIEHAIKRFHGSNYNSLGIICKTQDQADALYEAVGKDRRDVRLLDADSTSFSDGVMIATAYLAKGLEFDEVIVPFCSEADYRNTMDRQMLYVACTRAMHKLSLTYTQAPSSLLQAALDDGVTEQRRGG